MSDPRSRAGRLAARAEMERQLDHIRDQTSAAQDLARLREAFGPDVDLQLALWALVKRVARERLL